MIKFLPEFCVTMNFTSTVFLIRALLFIKKKDVERHKKNIFVALIASALFLGGYIASTLLLGHKRFLGEGLARQLFMAMLGTHTLCAVAILPLIAITLFYAFKDARPQHRKWAKITFPIWLYVTSTGIIIYFCVN